MKPSIGRTVIVKGIPSNGSDEHPGIITRVWGADGNGGCINVTLFPDYSAPQLESSVNYFDSRLKAEAYRALSVGGFQPRVAFPPDRE